MGRTFYAHLRTTYVLRALHCMSVSYAQPLGWATTSIARHYVVVHRTLYVDGRCTYAHRTYALCASTTYAHRTYVICAHNARYVRRAYDAQPEGRCARMKKIPPMRKKYPLWAVFFQHFSQNYYIFLRIIIFFDKYLSDKCFLVITFTSHCTPVINLRTYKTTVRRVFYT